jgi:hypothetical protein
MQVMMVKMVIMKIDSKTSKVIATKVVGFLCMSPSRSLPEVRFRGTVVSLYLHSLIKLHEVKVFD